jgi:hypothetical protein
VTVPELRDKVWEILAEESELPARVDRLVDLINTEKSHSYGIGYQDGARKSAPFIAHG